MAFLYEPYRGAPAVVCDQALMVAIQKNKTVRQTILEYRRLLGSIPVLEQAGNEPQAQKNKKEAAQLKSKLPGWIFSCRDIVEHEWIDSKGKNRGVAKWRNGDWGLVNGLIMCDFDHIENPGEVYTKQVLPLMERWHILFAFVTVSGEGLKVVFEAKPELGDIGANQAAFAKEAHIKLDEGTFDPTRLSFVCMFEDILYLDNSIYEVENQAFIERYEAQYFKGVTQTDLFGGNQAACAAATATPGEANTAVGAEDYADYRFCGIEIPVIIDKLLAGVNIRQGIRHRTVFETAKKLRYVCERSEKKVAYFLNQLDWVQQLDREDHNVDKAIHDAMEKPYSSYLPKSLKSALEALGYSEKEAEGNERFEAYHDFGLRLSALFDKFPCLREICYGLEPPTYPAALFVAAAFFGTLMTRTWYHFWYAPSEVRRLNYGIIVIGDPGCGKSFAGTLYKLICEPIMAVDKIGNDAINKYKKEKNLRTTSTKEQKKDGLEAPENIIRIHGTRTANGVFIEDMVKAKDLVDGHPMNLHLLTFSAELDQITMANRGGQWIDKTGFELLAFHNEEDNQQYKNVDSLSGPFNVYWNYVYTGTPVALAKKVNERNFGSGLFGRLGCIPMANDYFNCAQESKKTKGEERREETLREWAYRLDKVQGELPIREVVHETYLFTKEVMELAKIDGDKVDAFLIKRVPYYGINVSAPFIFMRHYKEWEKQRTFKCDKYDLELCQLVMEIQLHSQRLFFGRLAEKYFESSSEKARENSVTDRKRKSDDILNLLPETFCREDLLDKGIKTVNAAKIMICKWIKEGKAKKLAGKKGAEKWQKT